jgi:peptidoglycan-associated lipoprotein
MRVSQLLGFIVVILLALVAGCSSTGDTNTEGSVVDDQSMVNEGVVGSESSAGSSLEDPNSQLARRVIYFDYDSSEIAPEDRQLISAHAAYLAANGGLRVTLEGNADERGSAEYNIALGDQRAQSIRRAFELQGVMPEQLTTVSYGEEKPVAEGHSEDAWRLNRRVEIVYQDY